MRSRRSIRLLVRVFYMVALLAAVGRPAWAGDELTILPASAESLLVSNGNGPYLTFDAAGWGPKWAELAWKGEVRAADEGGLSSEASLTASLPGVGATVGLQRVATLGPEGRTLVVTTRVATDRPAEVTAVALAIRPGAALRGGAVRVELEDGNVVEQPIPLAKATYGVATAVTFVDAQGRETAMRITPAAPVMADGALRIVLAAGTLAPSAAAAHGITVELPSAATFYATAEAVPYPAGFEGWFPFEPGDVTAAEGERGGDELSLAGWLEAPAGRHGRIESDGDRLVYGGRPMKLWGLNVCYADCAPPKELAEKRAAFYARNGVNAVRLHKYADGAGWAGIQSSDSFAQLDPAALDRMDYFVAKLKERGIYVKLSPTFGVKLGRGDRAAVPYMDEFGKLGDESGARLGTGHGAIYLSRELQDLQIAQTKRLLGHRNPYTGMTYAEDPAVAVVELFNEDSALFYGTMTRLQNVPTLRARAGKAFTAWLKEKYISDEALRDAWGVNALNSFRSEGLTGESWERDTILPIGNPWFFDPERLDGAMKDRAARLHDTMRFLYEIQNDFYRRYESELRKAGYRGEVLASNWQAGRGFSHYYNLDSDAQVGIVDRHNYFERMGATMLAAPGSGLLSSGLQQVAGRPFMLSEWIHVFPNEFGAEGPAILGAYGMGLQGWDASFMFQNRDSGGYSERIGRDRWDATAPQVIGLFPAVARQVLRGDVRESGVVATRHVHVPSMSKGQLGFEDAVEGDGDAKELSGGTAAPREALAVAKMLVKFTDEPRRTEAFGVASAAGTYESATKELRWHAGDVGTSPRSGWFTIDTAATQAIVGFARGERAELRDVAILPESEFGAIYVTAKERDATIATGDALLITAIARARNTGMKVLDDQYLLSKGEGPILMEPVAATITLKRRGATVHVLNHAGRRTGRTVAVDADGTFRIEGAREKTCWYLVTF